MPEAQFQLLVTEHLGDLRRRLQTRTTESPEALLADLVPRLITGLAEAIGRNQVDLLGQAYEGDIGRPDFSVKDAMQLVGHVETKPPGAGADPRRFRGHDRSQWQRFQKLPNLLYTDGTDFGLYRSGERLGTVISLPFSEGDRSPFVDPRDARAIADLVAEFLGWQAVAPRSLTELAQRLAPLCSLLRDAVRDQLGRSDSEVGKAAAEVEEALFAGRGPDEVADAFAQVCAYSMLLARSRGAKRLGPADVEATLQHAHPVLGRVVRLLVDEATEEELGWALETVRALVEAVDFPALEAKKGPDTWLYFYETFLAQYDPRLRDQFGVYYTPAPVISAQVTLLDEIVRSRLEAPAGLASEGVTVLDPAVGTGSYPLRVVQIAAENASNTMGPGAVPGVITSLARNLFAFEVLVGPYAVAHLRISELIAREGGTLPPEGLQVYLTDTLDSPYSEPLDFGRQLEPLVEERRRALEVKGKQSILVCLGNPPYERLSAEDEKGQEKGGWVVHGEGGGAGSAPIFSAFLDPAREMAMFSHIASLYNLYVYFWRWALWKVFESPSVEGASNGQPGIVSFITAASYLAGPGFVGMRERLRRGCDEVWIIDLGGEGGGTRPEENVFAIQTAVAVCIACRSGKGDPEVPATVRYTRIRGSRADKFKVLSEVSGLADLDWSEASREWTDSFVPPPPEAWTRQPALIDLFPFQTPGTKVGRTWPIAVTKDSATERWSELVRAPVEQKGKYFADARHGRASTTRLSAGWPAAASDERIVDLTSQSPVPNVVRYGYRSFDRQWILADARPINLPRPPLWWAHSSSQIYLTSLLTGKLGPGPAVTLSAEIPDLHHFRGSWGGKDVIPLYRDQAGTPNVAAGALSVLSDVLGSPVAAEDLFAYVYGLLSSRAYVSRFWDELETAGLRVPITRDPALFDEAVALGHQLINLHTFGTRLLELGRGVNPGTARITLPIGPPMPEGFEFDSETKTLRVGAGEVCPVDPDVWDYQVSGLQVIRSWLRYRQRDPVGRAATSSSPLDRIRPNQWTADLDAELLEIIWVLERTLTIEPQIDELLARICGGETVGSEELPSPTPAEREAPDVG
jgi:Type ISP C-terminal specificity domain